MTVPIVEEEIALPSTAVAALVEAEGAAQDRISDTLVAQLLILWAGLTAAGGAIYSGQAVVEFAQRAAQLLVAAQRQAGRITEVHLRQQINLMGSTLPRGVIVDLPTSLRVGAAPEEVVQRPVRQVRYLESVQVDRETAVETARQRLERAALHDLQLARSVSAQQVMYRLPQARGWRRIIHPELGNVCGLCVAAADRIYTRLQRMDLHPGCRCTILPIIGSQDPGGSLNAEDLRRLYAAAGGTDAARLRQVRVKNAQHGEMGDIILPDGSDFRDPADVRNQMSERQLDLRRSQLQRQVDELRRRPRLTQWHADRLAQLEELLAAA